ncbi:hypothetical protein FHR81_001184 [Actinoalloteichus hoggarensis]|uniref:Uncharacterized protein n=1 Tax=Actinoalloteichus hoggarensis TaxID=1470176 RepID=A0A221VZH8_9PSEU|nr:hypothetical protein AHOG_06335 [Actinoalloteichus hoggarensis]MBB5920154.1 hypothetical protein [Actinoalloteichus hoggarensis]
MLASIDPSGDPGVRRCPATAARPHGLPPCRPRRPTATAARAASRSGRSIEGPSPAGTPTRAGAEARCRCCRRTGGSGPSMPRRRRGQRITDTRLPEGVDAVGSRIRLREVRFAACTACAPPRLWPVSQTLRPWCAVPRCPAAPEEAPSQARSKPDGPGPWRRTPERRGEVASVSPVLERSDLGASERQDDQVLAGRQVRLRVAERHGEAPRDLREAAVIETPSRRLRPDLLPCGVGGLRGPGRPVDVVEPAAGHTVIESSSPWGGSLPRPATTDAPCLSEHRPRWAG